MSRRIRIGYMRIKEVKGLMRIEFTPISKEEIVAILKGEKPASKS